MNSNPKFSVSLCYYAGEDPKIFKNALFSILHQTIMPNELVIVRDGNVSPDIEIVVDDFVAEITKKGVAIVRINLANNLGHGRARNAALNACSHDFVILCDADDVNIPERFEELIAFLSHNPDISVLGGDVVEVNSSGELIGRRSVKYRNEEIYQDLLRRSPFNQSSVILNRKMVLEVGGYRDVFRNEDYDLWVRLAYQGAKFANLNMDLVYMTVSQEFYERRGGFKYFLAELYVQRSLFGLHKSLMKFIFNVTVRFVVQVLMPNKVRIFVYKTLRG